MHIAVYGNSIVAKTLLLGLLQNTKHEITWIANAYSPVNRPIALSKSSVELLTKLNLWNLLPENHVQEVLSMNLGNSTNIDLELNAYNALQNELAYIISTKDLDNILDIALSFMPLLKKIEGKIAKVDYIDNFDGKPKQHITYESYINASSLHSLNMISVDNLICTQIDANAFNHSINPNYIESLYNHYAITSVLQSNNPHYGNAYQFFDKGNILALLPMPKYADDNSNQYALIWSVHNPDDKTSDLLSSLHANCDLLAKLGISKILDYDNSAYKKVQLQLKLAKKIIHNHIVLMGDAAHRVHPLAGQGLNLGLRDVADLLNTLDNNCNIVQLKSRLQKYEARRLIDMYKIAGVTHAIYNINNSSLGKWLISFSLKAINKIPLFQKIMAKFAN
ncbi:MAG: hypothetical protein RLZZ293_1338 [Pseudomonadota bacterium]